MIDGKSCAGVKTSVALSGRFQLAHALTVVVSFGLTAFGIVYGQEEASPDTIRRIDIVHMTHTDVGFTDHPLVCRRQQMRYLDVAIDAVLATADLPPEEQFYWTAETTLAVDDWWRAADSKRREDLLAALDTRRLEVAALAMNQTPAMGAQQWNTMLSWLPEELWQRARPRVAIQNDVNGFPRAGAMKLLDRGVGHLMMGINNHNGGPPFERPSAFWWKLPCGRRMFVWLGDHYAQGFYYFHATSWRRGPVPESTDTRYRPARPGDFFRADEASVRAAHKHLLGRLRKLQADGYDYPSLIVSVTNEWRMDNDPPFPALAKFVAAWRRLGLKPELHLSTAGEAMDRLKEAVGAKLPEYSGEWTDWWANGTASGPREVAASRKAKRLTAAALAPVWGHPDQRALAAADEIYRDLCLFDEHTWGSVDSIGLPHSLETWAQYNEKSRAAYRPLGLAKMLLAQRARSAVYPREEGFYVANTAVLPYSGWVTMPASALRGDFHSLEDPADGTKTPLIRRPGFQSFGRPSGPGVLSRQNTSETFPDRAANQMVRFWIDNLEPMSIRRWRLCEDAVEDSETDDQPGTAAKLRITVDDHNWPTEARWFDMQRPLFQAGTGDLISVAVDEFSGRWVYSDIHGIGDREQRETRRREALKEVVSVPAEATRVERNAHTTVYTQALEHPRCKWAVRRLELFHAQARARLTVRFHRVENELPEVLFVVCDLPARTTLPRTANGGVPFVAYKDQLPGTCRDYFTIDDWVAYGTRDGRWLWASRDAPLVTFGSHNVLARRDEAPENPGRILAMVYNNVWVTNFVADSHGALEFQFEFLWQPSYRSGISASRVAEALLAEPQVVINPKLPADPIFLERLHRP